MSERTMEGQGRAEQMRAMLAVGGSLSRSIAAMQAAWIEWRHGRGADAAMQWIENTLIGPGLIPGDDESDAQAFFDRAIAEIEEHRRGVEAEIAALAAPEPGGEGETLESRAYDIAHWIATEARVAESLGRSVAPIESEGARRIVALASARPTPAASEDVRELAVEIIGSLDLIARNYDSYEYGLPVMTHYDEMVDTVAALLRTPAAPAPGWSEVRERANMLRAVLREHGFEHLRSALVGQRSDAVFYGQWERHKTLLRDLLDAIDAALRTEAQGEEDAVRRTWELAVQRAYGCLDYCGGYRGAELEAFHSGIKTVIRALEAGPDTVDTQTAALDRIGAALRSEAQGEVWREVDDLLARLERYEFDAAGESEEYWRVVTIRDRIAAARRGEGGGA